MRYGKLALAALFLVAASTTRAQNLIGIDVDSGALLNISSTTGAISTIGLTGVPAFADIQFAPDGTLYGFTTGNNSTLYTINPSTARTTRIGLLNQSFVFEGGLAFATDGTAYMTNALNQGVSGLCSLNLATGASADIGVVSGGNHDINGLFYRADGQLIGIDRVTNSLLVINPTTAAASTLTTLSQTVGGVGGMTSMNGVAYFNTSGPLGVPGSNSLYSFDPNTGANTLIGSFSPAINDVGISGIAGRSSTVPEPGSLVFLAGMTLTGTVFLRRRKQTHKIA